MQEVSRIVCDLWPTLRADATLAALFPEPPTFALRRNKTIANRVVKAKHAPIFADHTIYKGDGNAPFRLESSELLTTVPLVPIYSDTYAATEPVPPKSATKVSDGTHPSSSGSALMHNGVQMDLGSGEKRVDMPLFGGGGGPDPKRPRLHPDDERMLAMYQPHGLGGAAPRGIGPREPCGRGHVSDVLGPDHWAPRVSGLAPLIGERHAGGGELGYLVHQPIMHPSPNPLIKLAPSSSLSTKKVPVIGLSVGLEVHRPVICPIPKSLITLSPNANPLTKMVSVIKVGVDKGVNHPMISPDPNLLIKPTPSPNPLTKKVPVGELSAGLGLHRPVICPIPNSLIARDAVSTVHPGTRLPTSCVATLYSPPDVPCQPHGVDTQLVVGDLAQKPCYSTCKATTSISLVPRPKRT